MKLSAIFATLAALAGEATAKAVFAHFMVRVDLSAKPHNVQLTLGNL